MAGELPERVERMHPTGARVKRRGKSPPGAIARWRAARLMGCKVKYTGNGRLRLAKWVARPLPGGRPLEPAGNRAA